METVIAIVLLATYIAFAVYAARGGNLMLGFFVMAVIWAGLGAADGLTTWIATSEQTGAGMVDINTGIFSNGPTGWGGTAVIVMFGSWFGRILVETNIARSIISFAVEMGGERKALTTILISFVTSIIFASCYGPGTVVAIGVIVFPILLSIGVPKTTATLSYLFSIGAGLYINTGRGKQIDIYIPFDYANSVDWKMFSFIAYGLQMLLVVLLVIWGTRGLKQQKKHAWAVSENSGGDSGKRVGILAMLTPIIPVVLTIFFQFSAITSILVAVIWALLFTGNMKKWNEMGTMLQKTFRDGVTDIALVLSFLFFLQMFMKSAKICAKIFANFLSPVIPQNLLIIFLIFGIFGFLALFRGPLTLWGCGTAILALLQSIGGIFTPKVLFPMFTIPATTVNESFCPTQSWNVWAIGYTKTDMKEYFRAGLVPILILNLVLEIIAFFIFAA